MIFPMKQIMNLDSKYIDSYSQKKKKKVYKFLQYEMEEKNDWCAHCNIKKKKKKKKKLRFLQRFLAVNICK